MRLPLVDTSGTRDLWEGLLLLLFRMTVGLRQRGREEWAKRFSDFFQRRSHTQRRMSTISRYQFEKNQGGIACRKRNQSVMTFVCLAHYAVLVLSSLSSSTPRSLLLSVYSSPLYYSYHSIPRASVKNPRITGGIFICLQAHSSFMCSRRPIRERIASKNTNSSATQMSTQTSTDSL